jgi:hypothetical protein
MSGSNYVGNLATSGADMHHGEFVAAFRRADRQDREV